MNDERKAILKRMIQVFMTLIIEASILFACAGDTTWFWGWLFVVSNLCLLILNAFVLPKEVIIERGKKKEGIKKWDRVVTGLMIVPLLLIFVISGLDRRFGWSINVPIAYNLSGILFGIFGDAVIVWAMRVNIFFSTMVRIQQERGHKTVTGGPYRFIRHPGYFGMIFGAFSTPMLLGSYMGLIAALLYSTLLIIRTALEDRTLYDELDGYRDYSERTRYRLIPYLW